MKKYLLFILIFVVSLTSCTNSTVKKNIKTSTTTSTSEVQTTTVSEKITTTKQQSTEQTTMQTTVDNNIYVIRNMGIGDTVNGYTLTSKKLNGNKLSYFEFTGFGQMKGLLTKDKLSDNYYLDIAQDFFYSNIFLYSADENNTDNNTIFTKPLGVIQYKRPDLENLLSTKELSYLDQVGSIEVNFEQHGFKQYLDGETPIAQIKIKNIHVTSPVENITLKPKDNTEAENEYLINNKSINKKIDNFQITNIIKKKGNISSIYFKGIATVKGTLTYNDDKSIQFVPTENIFSKHLTIDTGNKLYTVDGPANSCTFVDSKELEKIFTLEQLNILYQNKKLNASIDIKGYNQKILDGEVLTFDMDIIGGVIN